MRGAAMQSPHEYESAGAGSCVRPHLRLLRAVGFCRPAHPAATTGTCRLRALYHVFALCVTSTYVLQQLIYAYQEMEDMEKLSGVLFVVLCHVTCVAKQVVFYADAARVERLCAALNDPLFNVEGGGAAAARRRTARGAARLLAAYAGCAEATCVLWTAVAAMGRLRSATVQVPFWTGFPYDHPLVFAAVQCYSFYVTSLVAVGNTSMDAFIATVLDQCKTQLAILRERFETLTQRARATAARSGRDFDAVLHDSFVDCLLHYQKIIECCALLERLFGAALLVQFGVGGWILCMAAYKIVSLAVLSIEFASTTLFITCILSELLLYCYYGNEVTVESELVCGALYGGVRWRALGPRFRRALLIAMTRAQRPLRPAAGRVIPLTLQTYLTILKSSYSFYAVLRQTKSAEGAGAGEEGGKEAGSCVAVHLRLLRACGFCRAAGGAGGAVARAHSAYRALVLAVTSAYLAQECVYAYQERGDMEALTRVMFLLLCHVTSIAKQITFHRDADRIDRLVAGLDGSLYAGGRGGARGAALVARTTRAAARFAYAYSGTAVLTCTLWITFPVLRRLHAQPVHFPFYVPLQYASTPRFLAVLLYSYYVTTLVGIANTTMDAFVATVLKQCTTQITILRMNFESLFDRAAGAAAAGAAGAAGRPGGADFERAFRALFRESLQHYNKITEDVQLLQDIFGNAILIQFGIGGFILCMAAYQIITLNVMSIEFASMMLFICCILTELFLYCYYGNEVTVQSDGLVVSVYCMRWAALDAASRRSLVLVMERAKRPLRPAANHLVPLSLETFIKIIKFSYSFYAVLRQTK